MKTQIRYFLKGSWIVGLLMLLLKAPAGSPYGSPSTPAKQDILNTQVADFSSHQTLIATLIQIANSYRVPMGIEMVTPQAVNSPLTVKLGRGTVRELLDVCVRRIPGYRWTVEDGAVHVYGPEEREQKSNLFNFVVPQLKIRGGTLNEINAMLRMSVPDRLPVRYSAAPPGEVFSTFGDTPGVGSLEGERMDFQAQDETVRSILNRIVVLSKGKVIWIARVPPSRLSRAPTQGLWLLAPPSPGAIIPHLDPALKWAAGKARSSP